MWIITSTFPDVYLKLQTAPEYFWTTFPCVHTTCACKLCMHTDGWGAGWWQQLPGLQAPLQSPSAPVQPDASCQPARSAAAAASVPKHGQLVPMSVTVAPQTRYTCKNWWERQQHDRDGAWRTDFYGGKGMSNFYTLPKKVHSSGCVVLDKPHSK